MIDLIGIPPQAHAFVCIGIVLLMFVMFLTERYPTEVVAMGGACLMLISGILPFDKAVGVLSNSAPWTIALMFVLAFLLQWLTASLLRRLWRGVRKPLIRRLLSADPILGGLIAITL